MRDVDLGYIDRMLQYLSELNYIVKNNVANNEDNHISRITKVCNSIEKELEI